MRNIEDRREEEENEEEKRRRQIGRRARKIRRRGKYSYNKII